MTHPSDSASDPATEQSNERLSRRDGCGGEDADTDAHGSISDGLLAAEWHVSRTNDVALVTVHVTNTHTAAREVRLDNRLDGPVDPPCREGVAEAGWDDGGVTRRVPGQTRVSIGYACHASPTTPPVEIEDRPVGETDETPVDRALRSLGDFAPPRAAVSSTEASDVRSSREPDRSTDAEQSSDLTQSASVEPSPSPGTTTSSDDTDRRSETNPEHAAVRTGSDGSLEATGLVSGMDGSSVDVPTTVETWFRAVEARLDAADRLNGDVHSATPVIASLGGRPGLETLATTLDADAAALAHVAARASDLAARADSAAVPDLGVQR